MKNKRNLLSAILLLMLLAFCLRTHHLSTDLLFHRDQGLHSLSIWNIWHEGKLSLLDPLSDVDGLTHAPIYFWLMIPAYALSGGDPAVASLFQITLEVLSLPFLYLAIKKLFNQKTALLTLLIYSVSYGGIGLSRWLVNVTPILPLTNLLLFLLTRQEGSELSAVRKEQSDCRIVPNLWLVFTTSLTVGIITQMDAAIGVFLLPFIFWFFRSKFSLKTFTLILTGFLLPALPLIAFELRHNFVITQAVLNFSGKSGHGLGLNPSVFIANLGILFTEINKIISYPYIYISSILFVFGLYKVKQLKNHNFIYAFLLIPFICLSFFQRGAIGFFLISLLPLSLAISIYGLQSLSGLTYPLLILILCLNLSQLPNVYKPNNALIPIGNANIITLQDRKNIIDFMYHQANGEQFSVWFYTIPYFQEEVWDYMLYYYAEPKYGYLPEQTTGFSPNDLKTSQYFFAVYEPDEDRPINLESWQKETVKNFGPSIKTFSTHDLYINLHSSLNR
ncbi:glycosyltransferase family 39 protein [Patescibacteria group bacterium]|nr:glycosyltransferase family 39 protein [Patescibacteria group bacterium]MBU1256390.1 glycosyltransferase family 39 protein [Patescibacteria group bacterium]MBU1457164.1 glycosyltransferase family 39 protein [Patescibacteria group bacterium]